MPWIDPITNQPVYSPSDSDKSTMDLKYVPSIYAKEELPTWAEVYEEFYLGKQFTYDPNNKFDQIMDHYWKIPHKKYLIATVCNQFNKMILEDGYKDDIIKELSSTIHPNISDIRFYCNQESSVNNTNVIYTFPLPSGKSNPFIIPNNNYIRYDITKYIGDMRIFPILTFSFNEDENPYIPQYDKIQLCIDIINIMIKPFKEYFEGEIGWKNKNGELIESNNGTTHDIGSRCDPAL